MKDTVFREKSIERLKSPEQLNEYIRVARPGVWMLLAAVVLLLAGIIAWGVFGTIQTVVHTSAYAQGGTVFCFVSEKDSARIAEGQAADVGGHKGTVKAVSAEPAPAEPDAPFHYLMKNAGAEAGGSCYKIELNVPGLGDGVYDAEIVVESIHPVTFVIQ